MNEEARTQADPVSKAYSYYVFSLLTLLYMFDYIDRMIVASLFPFLKRDWLLTDAQCGLLVSAVYWSILIFSFPVSILIDRWSRKNSIGLMALTWSIATVTCAFTKNFTQLFVTRSAIGVGEAGYAPGGTALISALFPKSKRALFLGIWTASIPLGSAIGIGLGGVIAEHFGWRNAFGIVALPGLVIALLFFKTRDYKSVSLEKTDRSLAAGNNKVKMTKMDIVGEFTGKYSLIFTFFAFAGCTFVTTSLLIWLPTYFHRIYGLDEATAGIKSSVVMLFAIIGAPLGGYLADKWYKTRANARLLFCSLTSVMTGVSLFMAFVIVPMIFETATEANTGAYVQYGFLLLTGVTAAAFVPAAAAVTQEVIHPGLRATSYSMCVIVQNLLGSSLGPVFIGAISDHKGIEFAISILPLFAFVAAFLFFLGSRHIARDLKTVERVDLLFDAK